MAKNKKDEQSDASHKVTRSIMKYHGGKWRIAPVLIPFLVDHDTYVESCGGAGSMLLRKKRSKVEVYNDVNGAVVNVFRVARDEPEALAEALRLTPFARDELEAVCLDTGPTDDVVELARRTLVRSFFSVSSAGQSISLFHATPQAAKSWALYPDHIAAYTERLQGVVIENRDAKRVIEKFDSPTTLHFIDPPYVAETRSTQKATYAHDMDAGMHEELVECVKNLKGYVYLCSYKNPIYDALGWPAIRVSTLNMFRKEQVDTVYVNPAAQDQMAKQGIRIPSTTIDFYGSKEQKGLQD